MHGDPTHTNTIENTEHTKWSERVRRDRKWQILGEQNRRKDRERKTKYSCKTPFKPPPTQLQTVFGWSHEARQRGKRRVNTDTARNASLRRSRHLLAATCTTMPVLHPTMTPSWPHSRPRIGGVHVGGTVYRPMYCAIKKKWMPLHSKLYCTCQLATVQCTKRPISRGAAELASVHAVAGENMPNIQHKQNWEASRAPEVRTPDRYFLHLACAAATALLR